MRELIFVKIIIMIFFIYSCKNTKTNINSTTQKADSTIIISNQKFSVKNEENIEANFKNEFDILLPTQYRDWENENEVDKLNEDWFDLHNKDGKYYLSKTDYYIKRGYSECSGDSTKILNSNNNTILLLNNSNLEIGEVNSLKITKSKIWPKEKIKFNFNNNSYTIRAEGDVKSSEKVYTDNDLETFQNFENYKLYLSINNSTEMLFLEQKLFNDTFVELLFVGDIDRDGKLDFIFSANRDYEEERVLLFLSSDPKEGKQIRKVSEIAVQFDC